MVDKLTRIRKQNGKNSGLIKSNKYKEHRKTAVFLFVNFPDLRQVEIAKILNVTQAFISKNTNAINVRIKRLNNVKKLDFNDNQYIKDKKKTIKKYHSVFNA